MNVRKVLEQMRTPYDLEQQFLKRLGRLTTPVLFLPRAGIQVQEANAEAKLACLPSLPHTGLISICEHQKMGFR